MGSAMPQFQQGGVPQLPNFGDSLCMPTPFMQNEHLRQCEVWRRERHVSRGQPCLQSEGGGATAFPIFVVLTL